jgi:type I restriction enzyme M protein
VPANHTDLEKRLWDAADELRANSKLKSSEYSVPVLGLIFLRYADHKFREADRKMPASSGRRKIGKADYQAKVFSTFLRRLGSATFSICQRAATSARQSTKR